MKSRYAGEVSSLSIGRVIGEFAWRHAVNACKRFCYNYLRVIYDAQ